MIELKRNKGNDKELPHVMVYFDNQYIGYIIKGTKYDNMPYYFNRNKLFKDGVNTSGHLHQIHDYLYKLYVEIDYNMVHKDEVLYVVYDNCYFGYIRPEKELYDGRYIDMYVLADSPMRGATLTTNMQYSKLLGFGVNKLWIDDLQPATEQDFLEYHQLSHISFDETTNKERFDNYISNIK